MNTDNLHLDIVTINAFGCRRTYAHCAIVELCMYKTMQVEE